MESYNKPTMSLSKGAQPRAIAALVVVVYAAFWVGAAMWVKGHQNQ